MGSEWKRKMQRTETLDLPRTMSRNETFHTVPPSDLPSHRATGGGPLATTMADMMGWLGSNSQQQAEVLEKPPSSTDRTHLDESHSKVFGELHMDDDFSVRRGVG